MTRPWPEPSASFSPRYANDPRRASKVVHFRCVKNIERRGETDNESPYSENSINDAEFSRDAGRAFAPRWILLMKAGIGQDGVEFVGRETS
jgi:hypothetical protein